MLWDRYSSHTAGKITKIYYPDIRFEVKENTHIINSVFINIGDNGAVTTTNYDASIFIERSIFIKCRNIGNGAAVSIRIEGSSSFGLIFSCFEDCSSLDTSIGYSFFVDGTKTQTVQIENCLLSKNKGNGNDGLTIWNALSSLVSINISYCISNALNAGSSVAYCDLNIQKYCLYTHIESPFICFYQNQVESIFRCIFDSNDPKDQSVIRTAEGKQTVTSCIFKSCGANIFLTLNSASILSTDCFFDKKAQSATNVNIISENSLLSNELTFISDAQCNQPHSEHKFKKELSYNFLTLPLNSLVWYE